MVDDNIVAASKETRSCGWNKLGREMADVSQIRDQADSLISNGDINN